MKRLLLAVLFVLPLQLAAQFSPREYAERRDALLGRLPDAVVLVLGEREPKEDYLEFHQTPGMSYLGGIREPDAALVMIKQGGKSFGTAFVLPRDPAAEVWTGHRIGREGATRITGLPARDREELMPVLDSLASSGLPLYVIGDLTGPQNGNSLALTPDDQVVAALRRRHPQLRVSSANQLVQQLRGKKTPAELALIRRAVDITVMAHKEAASAMRPDMNEFEIEAVIEYVFRRNGAERPSFASIVGSGPNSTILHYNENNRVMRSGETVVIDIGASYNGYAADITRTLPTSGTFTAEQRQIYQVVRDAQAAAERNAKPGMRAQAMSDSATAVIAAGLARLGLIEAPNATYDYPHAGTVHQLPQVTLYYMHGLGHGIGLEVHDPEQFYFTGVIGEGSAFTIEPGIYVRANVLETLADTPRNRALAAKLKPAVERYKNVGVRIEDDYIVTDKGLEWISRLPRDLAEVEKAGAIP